MDPPAKGESVLGQRALIILNSKNTRFLKTKLQAFQKKMGKKYEYTISPGQQKRQGTEKESKKIVDYDDKN